MKASCYKVHFIFYINREVMIMQIKDVSKTVGLPIPTIRYYESLGMIHPTKKGYYKTYTDDIVIELKQIKILKEAGLSLKCIQTIFFYNTADEKSLSNVILLNLKEMLSKTLEEQNRKEQRIISSKKILLGMLKKLDNALEHHK